jgi:hypothetical protein
MHEHQKKARKKEFALVKTIKASCFFVKQEAF